MVGIHLLQMCVNSWVLITVHWWKMSVDCVFESTKLVSGYYLSYNVNTCHHVFLIDNVDIDTIGYQNTILRLCVPCSMLAMTVTVMICGYDSHFVQVLTRKAEINKLIDDTMEYCVASLITYDTWNLQTAKIGYLIMLILCLCNINSIFAHIFVGKGDRQRTTMKITSKISSVHVCNIANKKIETQNNIVIYGKHIDMHLYTFDEIHGINQYDSKIIQSMSKPMQIESNIMIVVDMVHQLSNNIFLNKQKSKVKC